MKDAEATDPYRGTNSFTPGMGAYDDLHDFLAFVERRLQEAGVNVEFIDVHHQRYADGILFSIAVDGVERA